MKQNKSWAEIWLDWTKNINNILEYPCDLKKNESNDLYLHGQRKIPLVFCRKIFECMSDQQHGVYEDEGMGGHERDVFMDHVYLFIEDLEKEATNEKK